MKYQIDRTKSAVKHFPNNLFGSKMLYENRKTMNVRRFIGKSDVTVIQIKCENSIAKYRRKNLKGEKVTMRFKHIYYVIYKK
jgi:hypothetical protein